jgi:hypothetical protein
MQINPTRPFIRMASLAARLYQDQMRKDNATTLQQQFAALDCGRTPTRSVFGGGVPITMVPNRDDPLERLWHLPTRPEAASRPPKQRNDASDDQRR